MYCNVCGKSNPKDAASCSSCGNRLHTVDDVSSPPVPTPKERAKQLWRDYDAHFQMTFRRFKSSPLAVVLTILFTLSIPLNLFSVLDVVTKISSGENRWGTLAQVLVMLGVLFNLVTLLSNLVVAICLWIQVGDGFKRRPGSLKMSSLRVLTVINIISLVACCIVWPLVYFREGPLNNGLWDRLEFETGNFVSTIMYISMLMMILYRLMIHKLLATMRGNTTGDSLERSGIVSVAVFQFLIGIGKGLVLLLWLATAESLMLPPLYLIFDTVIPILFGILLIKYKAVIEKLSEDYYDCQKNAGQIERGMSEEDGTKTRN